MLLLYRQFEERESPLVLSVTYRLVYNTGILMVIYIYLEFLFRICLPCNVILESSVTFLLSRCMLVLVVDYSAYWFFHCQWAGEWS
jgi:hypothetical protein